jgi:hypothetical protein
VEEAVVARGGYALARVAVIVRAPAGWLWWQGVLAAGVGVLLPGLTGRRIGVLAGAALFLIAAVVAFVVRRRRYAGLARAATRAGKSVFLQDRAVTVRGWRRKRRWWLLVAFLAAVGTSCAVPAAAGMLTAGIGCGLWGKAQWLGRWERANDTLLWVRTEWVRGFGAAGKTVRGFQTTGIVAGDARPGGARRGRTAPMAGR